MKFSQVSPVILLDNHGCLTYCESNLANRVALALKEFEIEVSCPQLQEQLNMAMNCFIEPAVERIHTIEQEYTAWNSVWQQILQFYHLPLTPSYFNRMKMCHYSYAMKLYPDALLFLEELSKVARVSIFSNALPSLLPILNKWTVSQYFEKIFISCLVYAEKPNHIFFDIACSNLFIAKNMCVLIDDTIDNIKSAKEYGMHSIYLNRDLLSIESPNDISICASLKDAKDIIYSKLLFGST